MEKEPAIKIQNKTVKIKPIDQDAPGFLPMWRRFIQVQRGLSDFAKAQPEDIDAMIDLLASCMIEPESHEEKLEILNSVSSSELMALFNAFAGKTEVPPANGGA
jgi:hypothetical protein